MSPPDPSTLLAESAWLQRLARRLVADPSRADDAAQETLVRALERPPASGVPLKRWLGRVLRNVVRQERRTSGRRAVREQARAETRTGEAADELTARLELHEQLVAAVRGLDEPYRTTVVLRFLEDLSPNEVAARMGVPPKTVHTRLERALGRLRERLDRLHGPRSAWAGLLLSNSPTQAPPSAPGPSVLAAVIAMGTMLKWSGAALALAALGLLATRMPRTDEARGELVEAAPGPQALAVPAVVADRMSTGMREEPAREALRPRSTPAQQPGKTAPEAEAGTLLIGLVLDLEQRPMAEFTVGYEALKSLRQHEELLPDERVTSDGTGRFELPASKAPRRIVATGRGFATVSSPHLAGPHPLGPVKVYVAPESSYAGRVIDPDGLPIVGCELTIALPKRVSKPLTPGAHASALPHARALSDSQGGFVFPSVGFVPGSRLRADADGFQTLFFELPALADHELLLMLAPAAAAPRVLSGLVLHADGSPATGAHVSLGGASQRSAEDGSFRLDLGPKDAPEFVRAVLRGHLPAEQVLGDEEPGGWRGLVLVLGGQALSIEGRVLDTRGKPVADAHVWTDDGTRFGEVARRMGGVDFFLSRDVESLIAGDVPGDVGRQTTSEHEGRFALTGLAERRYGLYAMHPRTLDLVGPLEVAAGRSGLVLRLPGNEAPQRIAGRVSSLGGEPMAGASITIQRRRRGPDGNTRWHRSKGGTFVETDEQGRFEIEALCVEGTSLLVSGSDYPGEKTFHLADEPDLEALHLRLPLPCHVRLLLDDPRSADAVSMLGEGDEDLDLTVQMGGILCVSHRVRVEDGVSDLLHTDESARTLVLWKDGREAGRVPLALRAGEVNEIRY